MRWNLKKKQWNHAFQVEEIVSGNNPTGNVIKKKTSNKSFNKISMKNFM